MLCDQSHKSHCCLTVYLLSCNNGIDIMFVKFVKITVSNVRISKDQRSILLEGPEVVSSQLFPFRMSTDKTTISLTLEGKKKCTVLVFHIRTG